MGLGCRLSAVGLLLSALQVCIRSQDQKFYLAIVGENVTFSPEVNTNIREITWLKGRNKVAEWEDGQNPVYFSTLIKRGELDTSSGNLTIRNVNTDDAAVYEVQVVSAIGGHFQNKKIDLEVLEHPPPPVLSCNISNGQIKILCVKNFSKDVHYSWYLDGQIVNDVNSDVYEFEKFPDSSKTVECAISVSKTKIRGSISRRECVQEPAVSSSRGRDGLIAIFVILLVIVIGVLLCWWKQDLLRRIFRRISTTNSDLLRRIFRRIPTTHSANYKIGQEHFNNASCQEESGQKEGEEAKLSQPDQSRSEDDKDERLQLVVADQDDPGSSHVDNKSQNDKGSHKEDENTALASEEEKNSQESKAVTTNDPPGNQENSDYENVKDPDPESKRASLEVGQGD